MTAPDFLHDRIRQLEVDLQVARTNANHWKARYERAVRVQKADCTVSFELPSETFTALFREATVRYLKPNAFAKRIVETVVQDKLYNAVLDQ